MKSFGSNGFQQLTRTCQIILADCLDRGTPEAQLLASDVNGDLLCRTGWFVEQNTMVPKARNFAIPYDKWSQLTAMRAQILSTGMQAELSRYRALKPDFFRRGL